MALKGVQIAQKWTYVVRIGPWTDLMREYPRFWRGVLLCTDAYEELQNRQKKPKCQNFHDCNCADTHHFANFAHHHAHTTNIVLECLAYNEALEALGDKRLKRCTTP